MWQEVLNRDCKVVAPQNTRIDAACAIGLAGHATDMVDAARRDTARTLSTLRTLIQDLGRVEESESLVLVTEGLPVGSGSSRADPLGDVSWLASEASAARVSVYVLQLARAFLDAVDASAQHSPVVGSAEEALQVSGLEALASMTRGSLFKITASADRAFERVALETSAYYLLGFEPDGSDRDGRRHTIQVRVARRNVTTRSRTEFMVKAGKTAARTPEDLATETLRSPVPAASLPLRVTTYSLRDRTTDKVRVLIAAEIGRAVAVPAEIAAGYALTNDTGSVVGGSVEKEAAQPAGSGDRACWPFTRSVLVDPGRYTLKFAAADPVGRAGSVEHPLTAQLQRASGLEWSDLVLIDPSGPGSGEPRATVQGMVESGAVGMYLEVYARGGRDTRRLAVSLDVAATADGRPIVSRNAALTRRGLDWIAAEVLALPLLPPGDYVARAEVMVDGQRAGRITRRLRIETAEAATGGVAPRALAVFSDDRSFIRPFQRDSVLRPDVIDYFVNRMQAVGGPSSAAPVVSAIEHARAGQFGEVSKDLAAADPKQLDVTFLRGLARFSVGDLEGAAGEFRAALRISSEFLPAAFYLGACYAAGGRDREAAGAWQTALITESEAIVYDVLADALIRVRDADTALEILQEARGKWADDQLLPPRLAAALALAGKDGEALATIGSYIEQHPKDNQALFLAMRLIYEGRVAGRSARTAAEDAQAITEYARLYQTAKGTHQEMVDTWVKFVTKKR